MKQKAMEATIMGLYRVYITHCGDIEECGTLFAGASGVKVTGPHAFSIDQFLSRMPVQPPIRIPKNPLTISSGAPKGIPILTILRSSHILKYTCSLFSSIPAA